MRANALEKLGKPKLALQSIKVAIQLEPKRWELYAKAARMFITVRSASSALAMLGHAEERLSALPQSTEPAAKKKRTSARQGLAQLRAQATAVATFSPYHATSAYRTCSIAKLPVEMLEDVFSLLIGHEQRYAPLLSHVCRFWRELCIAKPAFWYKLSLDGSKTSLARLPVWLERSRGRVSELELVNGDQEWAPALHRLHDIQWGTLRSLHLVTSTAVLWTRLRALLALNTDGCQMGNLDELSITSCTTSLHIAINPSSPNYDEADARQHDPLRSLTLRDCRLDPTDTLLSCRKLTSFHLEDAHWNPCPEEFAQFLTHNVSLKSLTLEKWHQHISADDVKEERLLLPSLTHLRTTMQTTSPLVPIKVHVPNLVQLQIIVVFDAHALDAALLAIVQNGGLPALEELHIQRAPGISMRTTDLLALSPRLRTLRLSEIYSGVKPVIRWLGTSREGSSVPCPRLKHINFSNCADITTSPLVALVKGRLVDPETVDQADPKTPIATLIVDGCPLVEAEAIPWFRQRVRTFSCQYMSKKQANYKR
jgi:F-box/TPR repeat protein Pof3